MTVRYVSLAQAGRRDGGKAKAETLISLGREDRLDVDGLRRLVGSISRYLGQADPADGQQSGLSDGLGVTDTRPVGSTWLLDALLSRLDIADALREVLGDRRFSTDVDRVLFALVATLAVAPSPELAAAEWATCDAVICGLAGMDDDQAYRAMDLLAEADTEGALQEAVFFSAADLLNLSVDILLFDYPADRGAGSALALAA